jgi:CheY-like chemotaxis protein
MENLSNIKVLVIDDSFVNRQYIKTVLEEKGIQVIEAGDGAEALDILESSKPDLIILDLLMPVMDGIETLQQIRNRGYNYHILVLTADIHDSTRQKCIQLGVSGFINKPTTEKEIFKLINAVFQN